ncbi:hypothetical protein [Pandoraea sp. NPDC087047]|uniref:hypothetical protein n=1 Tax=Pandoraea sp. NPDC087047 TaxID=3364390 RepID=UPI003820AA66
MRKPDDSGSAPQSVGTTEGVGKRGGKTQPSTLPPSFPRKGYVVWFYAHDRYLGYAWNAEEGEIKRAHVSDPGHAIYFPTFAAAMVATDQLFSPHYILHSPTPGEKPRLIR